MITFNTKKSQSIIGISLLLLTGFALNSCASISESDVTRSAGITSKGVRVCITNDLAKAARVHWVDYDTNDGQLTLLPDDTTCGEGTSYYNMFDVALRVEWRDGQSQSVYLGNSFIGYPYAAIDPDIRSAKQESSCGFSAKGPNSQELGFLVPCTDKFKIDEVRLYPSGSRSASATYPHLLSITRVEDSTWIEFRISIQK